MTGGALRILVHDYAGHPFQADLSRTLAGRGHEVIHAFFADDIGPKGALTRAQQDPETLTFEGVSLSTRYSKSNFVRRRSGDLAYGAAIARLIERAEPDLVLSGNTPTEAQERVRRAAARAGAAFVYWCQDFYSIAASRILQRRLPGPGHAIAAWYRHLERRQMRTADHVVHITDAFRPQTRRWGVCNARVSVIPNWGPIGDIPVGDRDTAWAREQALTDRARVMYTGTLALKHDPALLTAVAGHVEADMIVIASGAGADQLCEAAPAGMRCLPLQPFERFAEVLASADVLVAVIEREAGEYSVPSKVLSYLCAGRPIVLSAPADNLAARVITQAGAGVVVEPGDRAGFADAVQGFVQDRDAAEAAGAAGRAYAERTFDIETVADRFETVFRQALAARRR